MDGIHILKEIYNEETELGPCPTVMLTGKGSEVIAIEAIRLGAQDYIIKENISSDALYIAITKARESFDLKTSHNEAKAFIELSQKMDAIGKLTSGIAHDFNNLLTITFGNAALLISLLQKEEVDAELCIEKTKVIQKTTRRGADLVKRLMVFARQKSLEPVTLDINDLINDFKDLLERTLGDFVNLNTDLGDDLEHIDVDPSQLENAIINIAANARDVMLDGGKLTLKTCNTNINDKLATVLKISAGSYVKLSITDTGDGIDDEVISRVFDPFFTTKDVGKGTGLGLSMVYGFVTDSNGAIEVESQKNQGTTFHLYFPASSAEQTIEGSEDQESNDKPASKSDISHTILVVEDEAEIRLLTKMLLVEAGYNVVEAEDGQEALDIIAQCGDDIDLVFTDIAMPGEMNGVQAAARMQVIKPTIKLLFTSGHAAEAVPDMELLSDYPVLAKPYQPQALISKIKDALK